MRRRVRHLPTRPHLGQAFARAVTWLVMLAIINLSLVPVGGTMAANAAGGDLTLLTICTSHGVETIALPGETSIDPQTERQCSDCPLCVLPWGNFSPRVALVAPAPAIGDRVARPADRRENAGGLWFLDGRPLRAPPLA